MKKTDAVNHPMELYQEITERLSRKECVSLATIIARSGSGPREAGTSMLVSQNGQTMGTVGGGPLEAQVARLAIQVLSNHRAICRTFSLAEKEHEAGGMVCGGEIEVLIEFLYAEDPVSFRIFARLIENQQKGTPSWLVRSIRITKKDGDVQTGIGMIDEEGLDPGSVDLACTTADELKEECRNEEPALISCGDIRYFIQPSGMMETLFIFGAGHIAKELAPIASALGLRTVIVDDRAEFANKGRFPAAAQTLVTDTYEDCFGELTISASSFIVIVTHSHAHDQTVLRYALKTPARYIGMISSRRKREFIYESLRKEGTSGADLSRVHSPIGLGIGAQTPAEIAVSIAAELIAVRRGTLQ